MIIKTLAVGPILTNCYIVGDERSKEGAIIDPGGDAQRILDEVRRLGLTIKYVIDTHGHFDHIGGLADLRRTCPETTVWAHPDTEPLLRDAEINGSRWLALHYEPAEATDRFAGGDTLRLGASELRVLDAPGHCPGSVVLVHDGHALVGDVLFHGGVGRWDFPGSDYDTLARTMRDVVMTLPDDTIVYPGHGDLTTLGAERRDNFVVREMLAGRRVM